MMNYRIIPGLPTAEMITSKMIIAIVSEYFGISSQRILSKDRMRDVTWCRHLICFFIKHHLPQTELVAIGKLINRDHSTVIHSVKKVNDLAFSDKERRQEMENINAKILIKKIA